MDRVVKYMRIIENIEIVQSASGLKGYAKSREYRYDREHSYHIIPDYAASRKIRYINSQQSNRLVSEFAPR